MTRDKKRKEATRARMTRTGERYQAAHRATHPSSQQQTTATTETAESPRRAVEHWAAMEAANLPKGWLLATSQQENYEVAVEPSAYQGKPAAHLQATAPAYGYATLSQAVFADAYRGKRVRLSAALRCQDVSGRAVIWMRVDDMRRRAIAFDNMQARPLVGTTDWSTHAVVLDVDEHESLRIVYGLLLGGPGHVWVADLQFEVVGLDVPTTSTPLTPVHERPVNLDFGG